MLVASAANPAADALRSSYEKKKERERRRNAGQSATGRDIAPLPAVVDPARREACRLDLKLFLLTYQPHKFYHGFSDDLAEAVEILQRTILEGGNFALAMPRGGGKSTIAEGGLLWAVLYGHRKFVVAIGASKPLAVQLLENVQAELVTNEQLAEDFPEAIHPIRKLENVANRAAGQTYKGESTYIKFKRDRVIFATIPGAPCSGAIIRAAGLTGGLRGLNEKGVRPDLAIVDDWQTDQSARSASQTRNRLRLIAGAVRGLAGPGKTIAVYAPMTVIARGDGADQLLDRQVYPEWNGRRFALLKSFPANVELWREYDEIRRADLRAGGDGSKARAFYKKNRRAMDVGGVVAWEARKFPEDLSALEHAMRLYLDNPTAFMAEYQNDPKPDEEQTAGELNATAIAKRTNHLPRGTVPLNATRITGYVDVQHTVLYYVIVAWSEDFSGAVVDYGSFPDQGRDYFTLREARYTLPLLFPAAVPTAAVEQGLKKFTDELLARKYPRESDPESLQGNELCGVDWRDGNMTEAIARACRTSSRAQLLLPCGGKGIGPAEKPMDQYTPRPGERLGEHWILAQVPKHGLRAVTIDSNFWKSRVADALLAPPANPGAIVLWGKSNDRRGVDHQMFADHCTAETRNRLTHAKSQRTVDVWKLKPNKPDNHLFDCLSGAAVMASIRGCAGHKRTSNPAAPRKPAPPSRADRVRPLNC